MHKAANTEAAPEEGFYHLIFVDENADGEGASQDPEFQIQMHHELNRLVSENMLLQTKLDRKSEQLNQAKSRLTGSVSYDAESANSGKMTYGNDLHHINNGNGHSGQSGANGVVHSDDRSLMNGDQLRNQLAASGKETVAHNALLHISDLPKFIRLLVHDLKPRVAVAIKHCLPAYMLTIVFRYYDKSGDEINLSGCFTAVHNALRDILQNSVDLDVLCLWLVNTWRLFNLLKQYSPNEQWTAQNTPKQAKHCFSSEIDIISLRDKLEPRVQDGYKNLLKKAVEPVLSPKIVPAILRRGSAVMEQQEDYMTGGSSGSDSGGQNQHHSRSMLSHMTEFMDIINTKLILFGGKECDELRRQVLGQVVSWISANAINHLMFNKTLCKAESSMDIKFNASEVVHWLRNRKFESLCDRMESVIQSANILTIPKTDDNIDYFCGEETNKLSPKQILTLLKHYSPEEFEPAVTAEFIGKVSDRLAETRGTDIVNQRNPSANSLISTTYLPPLDTTLFEYSEVDLSKVTIPACLKLSGIASTM